MKPRKILLLDTGKEWGGGTNSMLELLARIDRRRFSVTALFYRNYPKGRGSTLEAELSAIGIPLLVIAPAAPPWWEKPLKELARAIAFWNRSLVRRLIFAIERISRIGPAARRIAAEIRRGGFELLYLNNQPGSNVEGYLAAAAAGIPVVQHCRIEPQLTPAVARIASAQASKIICVSEGVRDALTLNGIDRERCVTVYNGIDCQQAVPSTESARSELGIPQDAMVIGTVGQLAVRKRVADLIQALARLRQGSPRLNVWLIVAGEGPEAEPLSRLATRLGLADRVRLIGFDPNPLRLMSAMDVFALCSAREGLPRAILEAMLAGRPVVATDIVGSRELVVHDQTGILYPCGDIDALARAVARLGEDAALRQRMGTAARQRVRDNFSIERYVTGVEAILEAAQR